jgi:transketolase
MNLEKKDIRDIFFENIRKIFLKDKDFYILTNDADVFALQKLKNHKRFIDAGVCEQNLINIASGLARKKKKVLVYGFCNFLCHRSFEQIKINICSMKLPVYIVGIGPGFSFPYDGPTHHGVQDIANMYTLPELQIINLSENKLAYNISKNILKLKEPTYFRLDKGVLNSPFKPKNYTDGFNYFKSKQRKKIIITSGYFSRLAENLINKKKLTDVSIIDLYNFKKLNEIKLFSILKKYKKLIIYDENTTSGGFSFIINDIIIKKHLKFSKIISICSPEKQIFIYRQDRQSLLKDLKIDENYLYSNILKI